MYHVGIGESKAHGSVVGLGIMLQAGRLCVQDPVRSLNFFNLSSLPAITDPGVYSASNRNED
jgi:hypothetical protein